MSMWFEPDLDKRVDGYLKYYPENLKYREGLKELFAHIAPKEYGFGGWDVPSGWIPLILELHKKLVTIDPNYILIQAKEKFGGLRYYTSVLKNRELAAQFNHAIGKAEQASYVTCQLCGESGKSVALGYWYITLCPLHLLEECARRNIDPDSLTNDDEDDHEIET